MSEPSSHRRKRGPAAAVLGWLDSFRHLSRDNRLLALSLLLWGAGEGLFIYIQPLYLQQLGANPDNIGGVLAASQLVMGATFIPAGWLVARIGHRALLIASWSIGLVAVATMAFAPNLDIFVAGIMVYALSGFAVPVMSSYAAGARGQMSVEQTLSTIGATYSLGAIPTPLIGGWIGRVFDLPSIYRVALVSITASTLVICFVRPHPAPAAGPGSTASESVPPAGAPAVLWRTRAFVVLCALMFASMALMFLALPLAPNFLKNERGFDVSSVGALGTIASIGGIVLQLLGGIGQPSRLLVLSQSLMLLAVLLLWQSPWLPLLALAYFLRPSISLARLSISSITASIVEHGQLSVAYGITETMGSLALMCANLAAGQLYGLRPDAPFIAALALLPVLIAATLRFTPHAARPPVVVLA